MIIIIIIKYYFINYNMSIPKKRIIVISSPSGGGKTIVSKYILENYRNIKFSVSATTRQKRQGEKDGVHYYFLDKVDFETKIKNGELVEFEKLFDNYYGTLYSEIDDAFKQIDVFYLILM